MSEGYEWDHWPYLLCDGVRSKSGNILCFCLTGSFAIWRRNAWWQIREQNSLTITLLIKFLLKDWKEHAEADCFFCFTNLMSDIRFFFSTKTTPLQSESQGLLHQDPGRLRQWDPGHYGQICREVATTAKRFFHFYDLGIDPHIRLKEVDQVSADILNEQVGVS